MEYGETKILISEAVKRQCIPGLRLRRERKSLEIMMALYCRKQHGGNRRLCSECEELSEYAFQRLEKCPFGEGKTTCAKCPVHCYKPVMRERIRKVMRYSGPRMIYRHPLLSLSHMADSRRAQPIVKKRGAEPLP
jgi:hypothetical protein